VVVRSTVPPGTGDDLVGETFAGVSLPVGWAVGTAMCPEFLREGSGVTDFFNPPFVVVGTADQRVTYLLTDMFSFLNREIRFVDVRSAEALKYACNAFHATKVSFANEMARIFRVFGVDSREVMRVFSEDTVLNISPAYLMPGFAFGGSCLPKDLRALLDMARVNALDVPLLAGTARTNELVIADVVDRLIASPFRTVAMLGLSFKMDTDGSNLRYVENRLPHLRRLLFATPREALHGCDAAVVATSDGPVVDELRAAPPAWILDLHGRLGAEIERLPGYEGIGWAV
jgi:GDP-mannose 6-dehydrogenase